MGRKAVECNMLFIEDLFVPAQDLVGEEGKGFQYLLHGLNPERVLFAVEAIGLGRAALRSAGAEVEYHKYKNLGHGFGPGTGTSAEGWIADAVRFWEKFITQRN